MTEEKSESSRGQGGADDALVKQLKDQLREQGRKLALGDEDESAAAADGHAAPAGAAGGTSEVTSSEDPTANVDSAGDEDAFLSAMAAFRRAKRSGDREATAEAERHLQDVVRSQMSSLECQEGQG